MRHSPGLLLRICLSIVAPAAWVLTDFGGLLRDSESGPGLLRSFAALASAGTLLGVAGSLVLLVWRSVPSKGRTLAVHANVFGMLSALTTIIVTWTLSQGVSPALWVDWTLLAAIAAAFGANATVAQREKATRWRLRSLAVTASAFGAAFAIAVSVWMRSPERALLSRLPVDETHPGIPLAQVLGTEFDRAAIFGPYTSEKQMEGKCSPDPVVTGGVGRARVVHERTVPDGRRFTGSEEGAFAA